MADRRTPPADRRYAPADRRYAEGTGYTADHIAVRIKRGGGTGPVKPRQPPARERCQFHQAPTTSLGDVDMAASQLPPTTDPGGGFFICRQCLFVARNARPSTRWMRATCASVASAHSFKDRVVSVALARARELGFGTIACASTGNLANAVAAHAAAAGLESFVFIPADLEEQKILATGVYGTHVVKVRGNYDDVNRLCTELSGERDWAFVNVNLRPYYAEGSKTIAWEVAEQLGWKTPDRIVAPVASGSLYTKIGKGFREFLDLGLITG